MDKFKKIGVVIVTILGFLGIYNYFNSNKSNQNNLIIPIENNFEAFDPTNVIYQSSMQVMNVVNEGLMSTNNQGQIENGIAQKIEANDQLTNFKITLRTDAYWFDSQGTKIRNVKADDFVKSWQRTVDPKTGSRYILIMKVFKNGTKIINNQASASELGVKAIDDYTLEINTEFAAANLSELLAFPVFQPILVEKVSPDYGKNLNNSYFTGSFIPTKLANTEEIEVVKNKQYYDANKVNCNSITFKVIKDKTTQINAFNAKQLTNITTTTNEQSKAVNKGSKIEQLKIGVKYLALNTQNEYLKDANLRRAILEGFDITEYLESINPIGHIKIKGIVPSQMTNNTFKKDFRTENGDLFQINIENAKKLVQDYKQTNQLNTITLDFLITPYEDQTLMQLFKQEMQKIGLEINLKTVENVRDGTPYAIQIRQYDADYSDPYNILGYFDSYLIKTGANGPKYNNPAFDQLLNSFMEDKNVDSRWEKMKEAEKMLFRDSTLVPLYQINVKHYYLENSKPLILKMGNISGKYY